MQQKQGNCQRQRQIPRAEEVKPKLTKAGHSRIEGCEVIVPAVCWRCDGGGKRIPGSALNDASLEVQPAAEHCRTATASTVCQSMRVSLLKMKIVCGLLQSNKELQ